MRLLVPPAPLPVIQRIIAPHGASAMKENCQEQFFQWICEQDRMALPQQFILSLFDIRLERFLYISDRVRSLGYAPEQFTSEGGYEYWQMNIHSRQQKAVLLFSRLGYNQCVAASKLGLHGASFCMQYTYRTGPGEYCSLLQNTTVVTAAEDGRPLYLLTHSYDISHLVKKEEARMLLKTAEGIEVWDYIASKNQAERQAAITTKEQGIINLLSRRKSTKEIAQILHISPHTVDTHRRNLLRKSGCVDTTALITYCKMVGII